MSLFSNYFNIILSVILDLVDKWGYCIETGDFDCC